MTFNCLFRSPEFINLGTVLSLGCRTILGFGAFLGLLAHFQLEGISVQTSLILEQWWVSECVLWKIQRLDITPLDYWLFVLVQRQTLDCIIPKAFAVLKIHSVTCQNLLTIEGLTKNVQYLMSGIIFFIGLAFCCFLGYSVTRLSRWSHQFGVLLLRRSLFC